MPADPSPPLTRDVSESAAGPDGGSRRRATATATGRGFGRGRTTMRIRVAIAAGLIAAGVSVAFAWSEFYPKALAEADLAYRRNDLKSALRIAKGHLARRPFSRYAVRWRAGA